ncbi:MAG: hypothetical protein HUU01_06650 [Saprospiraceae bacterium]|nr:hypothetical protein [Saprospiraceae bacterium]
MIAYNRNWLDALHTKDAAHSWYKNGLLSAERWEALKAQKPAPFYSPNLFIRIGLGIFCMILMYAAMGLLALTGMLDSESRITAFSLFWAVIWIVLLEFWIIRSLRHYGSGLDDMMLYVATITLIGGLYYALPFDSSPLTYCLIAWPFLVAGSIRYLDRLMAAAAFGFSLLIVLLTIHDKIPALALYLLPFSGMLFSAMVWLWARKVQKRITLRYWHGLFAVIELLCLPAFYASGNYWVVQQAGADFFNLPQPPIGWFFWSFTFGVPVLYLALGLRLKDRLLLDIGIVAVAVSVFTFRYYHHVLPLAWACTIFGGILFVAAYLSISYLRKKPGAFTYEQGTEAELLQEIEEQLIEQLIVTPSVKPEAPKETFGGGDFGGGGAGGEY